MQTILTVLQVLLSMGIIALVLIQHGRGADAGAAFGSGASATVFGARGSGSFLSRATGILAALFFLTSMALAYYAAQGGKPAGLMDTVPPAVPAAPAQREEAPAIPEPAPAPQQPVSDVPGVPGVPSPTAAGPRQTGEVPPVPVPESGAPVPPVSVEAPSAQAKESPQSEAPVSTPEPAPQSPPAQ